MSSPGLRALSPISLILVCLHASLLFFVNCGSVGQVEATSSPLSKTEMGLHNHPEPLMHGRLFENDEELALLQTGDLEPDDEAAGFTDLIPIDDVDGELEKRGVRHFWKRGGRRFWKRGGGRRFWKRSGARRFWKRGPIRAFW
ncbi:unnamed protein product [Protopolystoma xenopodis]|uniref:Uncharacterized protein n=1 Tax=Protopolystoma xenopodis TaxID=117903 RepID=A0A3S5BQ57_9PLAT|nr:unnamed protein product [Protopolystoma xenopodis]